MEVQHYYTFRKVSLPEPKKSLGHMMIHIRMPHNSRGGFSSYVIFKAYYESIQHLSPETKISQSQQQSKHTVRPITSWSKPAHISCMCMNATKTGEGGKGGGTSPGSAHIWEEASTFSRMLLKINPKLFGRTPLFFALISHGNHSYKQISFLKFLSHITEDGRLVGGVLKK